MDEMTEIKVAILDYGLGNLFSIAHACERVGLRSVVTCSSQEIESADAVILPGVGAFGDAMTSLRSLGLVDVIKNVAGSGKPLMGICLGMQLLMSESHEFGVHEGLGIIEGSVAKFDAPKDGDRRLKVPQVGWNTIHKASADEYTKQKDHALERWGASPLAGLEDEEYMYFVHSYYVKPSDESVAMSYTRYGDVEFCSSLGTGNVFGCQYHPERSGAQGLRIYENFGAITSGRRRVKEGQVV